MSSSLGTTTLYVTAKQDAAFKQTLTGAENVVRKSLSSINQMLGQTQKSFSSLGTLGISGGGGSGPKGVQAMLANTSRGLDQVSKASGRSRERMIELTRGLEDATIGFGVNGFTGAVRGATNNLNRFIELSPGLSKTLGVWGIVGVTAVAALVGPLEKLYKKLSKGTEEAERFKKALEDLARARFIAGLGGGGQKSDITGKFAADELARKGTPDEIRREISKNRIRQKTQGVDLRVADEASQRIRQTFAKSLTKGEFFKLTRAIATPEERATFRGGSDKQIKALIKTLEGRARRLQNRGLSDDLLKQILPKDKFDKFKGEINAALRSEQKAASALESTKRQEKRLQSALKVAEARIRNIATRGLMAAFPFITPLGVGGRTTDMVEPKANARAGFEQRSAERQRKEMRRLADSRASLTASLVGGKAGKRLGIEADFEKRNREIGDLFSGRRRGIMERLNELNRDSRLNALKDKPRKASFISAAGFNEAIQKGIKPKDPVQNKIEKNTRDALKALQNIDKQLKSGITIEEIQGSAGPAIAG